MSHIKDTTKAKNSILYNKDLKNEESMYIIYIHFFFLPPFPERLVWMIYRAQKKETKKKEKEKDFNAKLQSHLNDGRKRRRL